jgi:hypothetical protein
MRAEVDLELMNNLEDAGSMHVSRKRVGMPIGPFSPIQFNADNAKARPSPGYSESLSGADRRGAPSHTT